jgi:hypothetical protein
VIMELETLEVVGLPVWLHCNGAPSTSPFQGE